MRLNNLKKLSFLAVAILGLTHMQKAHAATTTDTLDGYAKVSVTKGLKLTEVPSFDFGAIDYKGSAIDIQDKPFSGKLSWFDGTAATSGDDLKITTKIMDANTTELKQGAITITYDTGKVTPPVPAGKTDWFFQVVPRVAFDGTLSQTQGTSSDANGKQTYYELKNNGTDNWTIPVEKATLHVPANLKAGAVTLTTNWDIATTP